ncbi:MFS transporter, partial [Pseudomonas aeruginosa]|nr:MFS transporter [Pseudomonas aeruginosa]
LAALSGGYMGGWLADRLGHRRALQLVPAAFAVALAALPPSLGSSAWFVPVLMVWSAISWMISPVVQSFLLRSDPASGSAGVALNTSAMHLGVGLGAALGGLVVALLGVAATPWVGLALVLAALACALGACALSGAAQALPLSRPAR